MQVIVKKMGNCPPWEAASYDTVRTSHLSDQLVAQSIQPPVWKPFSKKDLPTVAVIAGVPLGIFICGLLLRLIYLYVSSNFPVQLQCLCCL